MAVLPAAFTTVAPCGTCTLRARAGGGDPIAADENHRIVQGGAPVPSTRRAPVIAVTGRAPLRLGGSRAREKRAVNR